MNQYSYESISWWVNGVWTKWSYSNIKLSKLKFDSCVVKLCHTSSLIIDQWWSLISRLWTHCFSDMFYFEGAYRNCASSLLLTSHRSAQGGGCRRSVRTELQEQRQQDGAQPDSPRLSVGSAHLRCPGECWDLPGPVPDRTGTDLPDYFHLFVRRRTPRPPVDTASCRGDQSEDLSLDSLSDRVRLTRFINPVY